MNDFLDLAELQLVEPGIYRDPAITTLSRDQEDEIAQRDRVGLVLSLSKAEIFEQVCSYHSVPIMLGHVAKRVEKHASAKGAVIVDLGAGWGWHWTEMAKDRPDLNILLVDFSLNSLRICRKLMPVEKFPNVICLHGDIAKNPLRDGAADLIWSVQVFQHLPPAKRLEAMQEVKRLLAPVPSSGAYLVWFNDAPLMKLAYRAKGKTYVSKGNWSEQLWLQRFDKEVLSDAKKAFGNYQVEYSETLFQPEFRLNPSSKLSYHLDRFLSALPGASTIARQAAIVLDGVK